MSGLGSNGRNANSLLMQAAPPGLTPERIAARYGLTGELNQRDVTGDTTDQLGWVAFDVDRPTCLIPLSVVGGNLYCAPHKMPALVGANRVENAIRAWGRGVLYLWAPGRWWVKYSGTGKVRLLQVPCEDATLAAAIIFDVGAQIATATGVSTSATPSTVTTLAAANADRRSITIQSMSTNTASVLISPSATIVGTAGAQTGIELIAGGSITLTGHFVWTNTISMMSLAASQRLVYLETE